MLNKLFIFLFLSGSIASDNIRIFMVEIKGMKFIPQNIIINEGDKIEFINRDKMIHDAVSTGFFKTKRLKYNENQIIDFKRKGVYNYKCSLHPNMKGTITVQKE